MEKATIYDYARMCKFYDDCKICPLGSNNSGRDIGCDCMEREYPDEADKIILNWCKEHPAETRQDRFLKMFPNATIAVDGLIKLKPCYIEGNYECVARNDCLVCRSRYWLKEV